VIQPVARAADTELYFLEQCSSTWRFHNRSLEHIALIRERVRRDAHPLLAQLLRYMPEVATGVAEHDLLAHSVRERAATAQDSLLGDPMFKEAVETAHARYVGAGVDNANWQGAYSDGKRVDLAAQYVVNKTPPEGVPDGYTAREFWAAEGALLLEYRSRPEHQQVFIALETEIGRLRVVSERLLELLGSKRDELADSLGMPAAIPA
jgi:hypothetical protein